MSILSDLGESIGNIVNNLNSDRDQDREQIAQLEEKITQLESQLLSIQTQLSNNIHTTDIRILSSDKGIILLDENSYQYRVRINDNKLIIDNLILNKPNYAEIPLTVLEP